MARYLKKSYFKHKYGNYFDRGHELIVEAAEAQLEMMGRAEKLAYACSVGSSDIFELALRRSGEDDLASKFVNPNPDKKSLSNIETNDVRFPSPIFKHYDFVIVMNEDKLDYYPGCYQQFK